MNLADPQTLRSFLERHGLFARKGLGQHFLCSRSVVEAIIECLDGFQGALEIGPGPGVLTAALTERIEAVLALEIDREMTRALRDSAPAAQVVFGDALKEDLGALLRQLPEPRAVVSNLPYYITAPLINRIAAERAHFAKAVLMMQKEVAQRIVAREGDSARGSLSVYLQALFEIRTVALAPAKAFLPPPKVDSMVLEFRPIIGVQDTDAFFDFVRLGFSQPRKTLANNLSPKGKGRVMTAIEVENLSASIRPHELSLEAWRGLYRRLTDL